MASKLRITFDSQVLGKVASPGKRKKDPDHACLEQIHRALREEFIQGFICESIATLEPIKSGARARYFANRIPKKDVQTRQDRDSMSVHIAVRRNHDRRPGLHEQLVGKLERARGLGIHVLQVPAMNIQLPKYLLNNPAFYDSSVQRKAAPPAAALP